MQWQWNVYREHKSLFLFFFTSPSLENSHLSELLGLHLLLKGNGKAPTKLNVLFIHVNSIKPPKRLPASMKGIQRWSGTGCGSPFKGRELGLRIQCTSSQVQVPWRTRDISPAQTDPQPCGQEPPGSRSPAVHEYSDFYAEPRTTATFSSSDPVLGLLIMQWPNFNSTEDVYPQATGH